MVTITASSTAQRALTPARFGLWLCGGLWVATLAVLSPSLAAQSTDTPPSADAPLPPKVQDPDEQIQPQVNIRQEDDRMVHEYSIAGQIYMVKVIPAVGPEYYLIDTTGDGDFDERHDHMAPVKPAYWRLFDW